ncbi:hypothetical protein PIB30_103515 [Stylosanthes scabra]|uniref:DNA replication factor Cdt1 C-terminal domain-containing protein n=1 Tax=Stylosanthes scabra TaxID=79078 RepID=A0ABU6QYU0_9FABA|nr:hypothetical protein [Stylosanthes scabra]
MSTPDVKCISTPASITPALPAPKRHFLSPDDNSSTTTSKLVRRPPLSRSLFDEELLDVLPQSLLQSIREKEIQAMEERDPAISQVKRRKRMIVSLPKMFNMIHLLLQSMNRSVITKAELVSKIISGNCGIVDRSKALLYNRK